MTTRNRIVSIKGFNNYSFESKALEYFKALKSFRATTLKFEQARESGRKNALGLVHRILFEIVFLMEKIVRWVFSRRHAFFEKRALSFLWQRGVREHLCSSFSDNLTNCVTEDYVIKTTIYSLGDPSVATRFSIPLDPELFAHFADQITKIGVDAYCRTDSAEI